MSQPEILRRCTGCGASFHEGALFCPQCGSGTPQNALTGEESGQEISNTRVEDDQPFPVAGQVTGQIDAADELPVAPKESQPNFDQTMPMVAPPPTSPAAVAQQAIAAKATAVDRPGQAGTQAGSHPRSDNRVKAGVEKLRKGTSSAYGRFVMEEAVVDSGLRFVLIAGFLFVLFIILLVLSKWMN